MKKIRNTFLVMAAVAVALSVMVGGCNKPTAEMNRARDAINDARMAGAPEYAAAKLASAEDALAEGKKMMDNLRYKKARAAFEKAYRLAREAKQMALNAQQTGPEPMITPPTVVTPMRTTEMHTVVKGECLWWIAEYKEIYGDPFQWPLIYDANRDNIDRTAHGYGHNNRVEDWIFPGQEFDIPRDASTEQIKNARRRAGAPDTYMPPGY